MKRSLLAAAAAVVLAVSPAAAYDLKVSGYWKAFLVGTKETPICGMSSSYADPRNGQLLIKYFYGQDYLTGHIVKPSWRFPADGVAVPLTIGVDRNPIMSGSAVGYLNNNLPMLEFYIKPEKVSIDGFLNDFAKAARFWVRFDEGTEKPWVFDMQGSAEVVSVFRNCTLRLIAESKSATQPYGKPQATQPFGKPSPAPAAQPAPAKSDNGQI
jgi:hypothetical protein